MRDAVVVCELGPNPAPISELVQALRVQRDLRVRALFLLTNAHGEKYLHELDYALRMFARVYGEAPAYAPLAYAWLPDGARAEHDRTPEESAAWMQARWANVLRATEAAGDDPVVFAIAANRERSVLTTAMYTLLARPGDLCLDVRVSDERVKGAKAGFFFPTQPAPCRAADGSVIDPASVVVTLVALELPRLRPFLGADAPPSYEAALVLAQGGVDAAAPPRVVADFSVPRVTVNGVKVALTEGECLVLLSLLLARVEGDDDGWVRSADTTWLTKARQRSRDAMGRPGWEPQSKALAGAGAGGKPATDPIRTLRSKMVRRLKQHHTQGMDVGAMIPEVRKYGHENASVTSQRIKLDPRYISLLPLVRG